MTAFSRYLGIALVVLALFPPGKVCAQAPTLSLGSIEVFAGDTGAPLPITLSNPDPVDAVEIAVNYDPLTLEATEISFAGSVLEGVALEFFSSAIDPQVGDVTMSIVLDSTAPFQTQIAPGNDQLLVSLLLDVEEALLPGTAYPVQFVDGLGNPPISNRVFVNGNPIFPDLEDGEVLISTDNVLIVRESVASPGATDHLVELAALNGDNVQGFSIVLSFDPDLVESTDVTITDTITEAVGAEFMDPIFNNSEGYVILGVLLDAFPPFDGQTIPATGIDLTIANFFFDVLPDAGMVDTVPLTLVDGLGDPPISNIFVIGNQSITPQFLDGFIDILELAVFIRGDSNNDLNLSIADAVFTLNFMSGVIPEAPCILAMDANDDELANMADAIYTLAYLFQGGPPIPAPFPDPGVDPTPTDPPLPCDL